MSISVLSNPHFLNQPDNVKVFWGYGLYPLKVGTFVNKPMIDCTGEEVFMELANLMRMPPELVKDFICIPCIMPFITSQFQPRAIEDRPLPVPKGSVNIGLTSQYVEVPHDCVFTVEYSIRSA